jgi:hypothetical protein
MSGESAVPRRASDWLALATAGLFAVDSAGLLAQPETAVLRLAVLGIPGAAAYAIAIVQLGLATLLIWPATRLVGALGLTVIAAVTLVTHWVYRDTGAAGLAAGQLLVVVSVLLTARRRRRDAAWGP